MTTVTKEMLRRMSTQSLSGVTFFNNPEFLRESWCLMTSSTRTAL